MALLSPPRVYVVPGHRHYRRHGWWGYNSKNNDDEPQFNDDDIAHDDNQLNESDLYETASQVGHVDLKAEEKKRDENPLSKQHYKFEKVHCDSCNGHTMLRDGVVHESNHLIGCHKKPKTHVRTVHTVVCEPPPQEECEPPPEDDCEEEDEESSTSSCDEEKTEKKEQCIEIYLEDCDKLARQIESSYMQNKPFRGTFNKKVESSDGKGSMEVKVSVASSVKNSKGVAALQFSLVPLENGKKVADSTITATLWHLDLNNAKTEKRVVFQRSNASVFKEAEVPHDVLLATTSHVDAALSKLLKKK